MSLPKNAVVVYEDPAFSRPNRRVFSETNFEGGDDVEYVAIPRADFDAMLDYIQRDVTCPCCEGTESCSSDCTFSTDIPSRDDPADPSRMARARAALRRTT